MAYDNVSSNFVSANFRKSKSPEIGKSKSSLLRKKRTALLVKPAETESDDCSKKTNLYVVQSKRVRAPGLK